MRCKALKPTSRSEERRVGDKFQILGAHVRLKHELIFTLAASMELRRLAYILQMADSFVASKYCKWRKGSRPRKGSRSVAWLDGMVETLVRPAKLWSLPGYRIS